MGRAMPRAKYKITWEELALESCLGKLASNQPCSKLTNYNQSNSMLLTLNRVRQNCPKCTEFIIPGWILFQWPCGVPEHFSESTVDLWKWRLTFFWPPLVKYKVKICPNWNFVINLIWNVLCSFTEHFKAAF